MCGPPALALAAAGVAMVGQGFQALQANASARYQAKVADRNAALEREAGVLEEKTTKQNLLAHYRKVAQLKGQQRLAAAANGVSVEFGTAADVMADTDMLAREDVRRLMEDGYNRRRSRDIAASNYVSEAQASRQAGKGALVAGAFSMASTALGGATQYSQLSNARGPANFG